MSEYITLGFNLFCIAMIIFGMFWGLVRGLNKTVSRFLFLLILGIILIFVTIPITNAILKIPVNTTIVEAEGEIVKKVPIVNLLSILMEDLIGKNFVTKYPEFSELIISLPLTLVYVVVFTVLFWVLKYLLIPLNALINRLTFNRKRKRVKQEGQLGFSAFGDDKEYPNSDSSIEPLMDIYKQAESAPEPTPAVTTQPAQVSQNNTTETPVIDMSQPKEEPKSKKELKKEQKKLAKEDKPKKHRLLGSVVGAFVGIVLIFYTMIPFYGIVNIADSIKNTKINNLTEKPTTIDELAGGILGDIVKGYDLSALGRISEALAIENLGVKTFDHLTTTKIKDDELSLRGDVSSVVSTIVKVDELIGQFKTVSDNSLENMTQVELDKLIDSTDKVITACNNIKFVDSISDYIVPLTYEIIKTNNVKLVEDSRINELVMEMLSNLSNEPGVNVFDELHSVVEVVKYVNNQRLLLPLVTNNMTNIVTVFDSLDEDFGEQLSNKIFAIKTVDTTLPQLLNIGLKFFDNATNFGYIENTATKVELELSMTQLITSVVDTARSLSEESSIYLTDESIVELGKVLNTFRNSKLFNIETYNNLIDFTMNKVKTMTTDIVPANFNDVFNNKILRNIGEVTNWQAEMTTIYQALQILRDNDNGILGDTLVGQSKRVGYTAHFEFTEGTLINLGKALDKLESSVLFGSARKITHNDTDYTNTTLVAIFSSLLTEINESIDENEDETTTDLLSIINNLQTNLILSSHTYTTNSKYWEDEMTAISPLFVRIADIANGESFELDSTLGEDLDKAAHDSVMLGGDTTLILMEKLMAIVQDSILGENFAPYGDDRLDDKIYNLLVAIRTNLLSNDMKNDLEADEEFWSKEMDSMLALSDIAETADSITTISSAMDIADDLDKIYQSRIIPSTELNATLAKVLRQLKTSDTEGIEGKINALIEDIALDITNETFFDDKSKTDFWTIELDYINTLNDIKFEDDGEYKVVDNLSSIGANIDDIVFGDGHTRASYLITENRIRDILSFVITDMKDTIADSFEAGELKNTITSTLDGIATNLYNSEESTQVEISSFESELGNLTTLANLDISSDLFKYTNNPTELQELENNLAELGSSLDSIAYNTTTSSNTTAFNEDLNSNIITRQMIANIISAGFSTAKITAAQGDDLSDTEVAFNTLIDDIKTNISSITTANKVIKWQRELAYVSTLIQLNSGEEFTIENAATDIGANIDKIAFNHKNNTFLDVEYNTDKNIVGKYIVKEIDDTDPDNIITTYYNSVIITRTILKTAISSMVEEFKVETPVTSEDEIANELIDNLSTKVAIETYTTTLYNDYESALTDLNSVKTTMETTANNMSSITIETLTDEKIDEIDTMLDNFESKIICGTTTTRNIAVMLVEKFIIENPTTTEEEITNEIIQNTKDQINGGHVSDYAVVFTDLKNIKNEMSNIQTLFENNNIENLSRDKLSEVDEMLENFQTKSICGVLTTRKIAKLMVEKAQDSITNNGTNNDILLTEVGTVINDFKTHYNTGISSSSTTAETYYSATTAQYANPMTTIYDTIKTVNP